jgi:predicted Zn-dependent protease
MTTDRVIAEQAAQLAAAYPTDICVDTSLVHHLRYGGGQIVMDQTIERRRVTVRTLVGGHLGIVHSERCDAQGLARAVERAAALAKAKRGPTELEQLPDPQSLSHFDGRDEGLMRWPEGDKNALVVEQLKRAKSAGLLLAGSVSSGSNSRTLLSSRGALLSEEGSNVKAQFISQSPEASGYSHALCSSLDQLDLHSLCDSAIQKAALASKRVDLDIGRYDVVLEPHAVAELLEWMGGIAFTGQSVEEGTSFVGARHGESVTGANITLFDDASCPFGLGLKSRFDGEGSSPQRVTFVDAGKAGEVVHSSASATRKGCLSTGHSDGSGGEQINHMHMAGGQATLEGLVGSMKRGIWVNRFHYVNGLLDPPKATMTGLTRDGCLYVEDGRPVGGFAPMRFTESILEAFGRCDGLTEELSAIASSWSDGSCLVVPSLLLRDFAFTSKQKALS